LQYRFFHQFCGHEVRDALRWYLYTLTGFRVAPYARLPLSRAETSETDDLDLIALLQRSHYTIDNGLDDDLGLPASHLHNTRDLVDQICFCHPLCDLVVQMNSVARAATAASLCPALSSVQGSTLAYRASIASIPVVRVKIANLLPFSRIRACEVLMFVDLPIRIHSTVSSPRGTV
jgi:hypothetical protein